MSMVHRESHVEAFVPRWEDEESRTGAVEAIRALIEPILLEPERDELKITLKGDLAGTLSAARDSKDLQHIRAAFGDVVRQELNPVSAHQSEKGEVPPFKVRFSELEFDGGELALQDSDEEVPAAARRLQEPGVNALCLALDEVEHRLGHPRRCEYLPVVGDTLF